MNFPPLPPETGNTNISSHVFRCLKLSCAAPTYLLSFCIPISQNVSEVQLNSCIMLEGIGRELCVVHYYNIIVRSVLRCCSFLVIMQNIDFFFTELQHTHHVTSLPCLVVLRMGSMVNLVSLVTWEPYCLASFPAKIKQ